MKFAQAIDDYVSHIRFERGYSQRTHEMYQSRLRHFLKWLAGNGYPDADLTAFTTPILRRYLYACSARGLRPRTIRGLFHPLTGIGEFLIQVGAIAVNPTRTITMPKKDAADRTLISDQELSALMSAVERQRDPKKVAFQRAVLSVLINTGVRAQECLDLEVSHVSFPAKTLLVAHGKGEKSRLLYPPAECMAAIKEWLLMRDTMECTHNYLWAFDQHRRMGYEGLRKLLKEVQCLADMRDHTNIKCHAFRRAFATRLHQRGGTIKMCQSALGHSMAETTFKYLFLGEAESKAMAELAQLTPIENKTAVTKASEPSKPQEADPSTSTVSKRRSADFIRHRRSR